MCRPRPPPTPTPTLQPQRSSLIHIPTKGETTMTTYSNNPAPKITFGSTPGGGNPLKTLSALYDLELTETTEVENLLERQAKLQEVHDRITYQPFADVVTNRPVDEWDQAIEDNYLNHARAAYIRGNGGPDTATNGQLLHRALQQERRTGDYFAHIRAQLPLAEVEEQLTDAVQTLGGTARNFQAAAMQDPHAFAAMMDAGRKLAGTGAALSSLLRPDPTWSPGRSALALNYVALFSDVTLPPLVAHNTNRIGEVVPQYTPDDEAIHHRVSSALQLAEKNREEYLLALALGEFKGQTLKTVATRDEWEDRKIHLESAGRTEIIDDPNQKGPKQTMNHYAADYSGDDQND